MHREPCSFENRLWCARIKHKLRGEKKKVKSCKPQLLSKHGFLTAGITPCWDIAVHGVRAQMKWMQLEFTSKELPVFVSLCDLLGRLSWLRSLLPDLSRAGQGSCRSRLGRSSSGPGLSAEEPLLSSGVCRLSSQIGAIKEKKASALVLTDQW